MLLNQIEMTTGDAAFDCTYPTLVNAFPGGIVRTGTSTMGKYTLPHVESLRLWAQINGFDLASERGDETVPGKIVFRKVGSPAEG